MFKKYICVICSIMGLFPVAYAALGSTHVVAVNSSGNPYYVQSGGSGKIIKFSNGIQSLEFGSLGTGNGQFGYNYPHGLTIDTAGYLYVADTYNNRIQIFNSSGVYQSQFGSAGTGNGQFNFPAGIAIDTSGNIYVADALNNRIQIFNSSGVYQSQFGSAGTGNGQFSSPSSIAINTSGDIYVLDEGNSRIQIFNSSGVYQSQFGSAGTGNGQFNIDEKIGSSMVIDLYNRIYVVDEGNSRIQKFNSSGVYLGKFERSVAGIAIDNSGTLTEGEPGTYLYVTDGSSVIGAIFDPYVVDSTSPTLSQTTAVTTPTNDNTPAYTFTSSEAGTITYGGSCSSATTSATVGANTISFNTLADGAYSNCTITVTDAASNASSALAVTAFTVDTTVVAPVVARPSNNETIQSTTSTAEGTCETGATVSISNAHLQTNPTTVVCSGGVFSTSITFLSSGLNTPIALSFTQTDVAGNVSSATVKNVAYALQTGSGGGGGAVIHEEKKEGKAKEKEAIKEEKKDLKNEQKTENKNEKEQPKEEKKDKKNTKAEILSEAPLYEPFATRERTLSIALKLSGIEVTGMYICQNKFTDTPTPYSCEVAEKSQAAGLISQERTTFRPARSVTRVEAYAIFMKSICVAPETNENNWKKLIIKKAIELGFTSRTVETFSPDRAITTPEMFALAKQIGEWKAAHPNSCQNK